jgi:hypothetical protein
MMTTVTYLLPALLTLFVMQQLILALAGLSFRNNSGNAVAQHRRIAVFLFAEKMEGNIRQMLLQLIHQAYPEDKFKVFLVTSDRKNIERFADLPVSVLLTYDSNKVANCRQALLQTQGVFDIAVSIHQPLRINEQYLAGVNAGFQEGSYFMQPWLSRSESNFEIVPEPEAGFQSLHISVPINNAIYSTPFLWLKQQLEEMKDIENYHHGLQYRLLEQGNSMSLLRGMTALLTEDAKAEKKGLINRLQFGLRGFRLMLSGKPSMFFIGLWKFQPIRLLMIPTLIILAVSQPVLWILPILYLTSCMMIMVKHPEFELRRTILNFTRQFGSIQPGFRKKRTALNVSTAD